MRDTSAADEGARRSLVERLLVRWRPYDARRLTQRELRVEAAAALSFTAAALALALLLPHSRSFDPLLAVALIGSLALANNVHLHVGAGFAVPTQLVLVPMLFLLPPAAVPACVGLGLILPPLIGTLRGREHPERIVTGAADAWHAVPAALVVIAAGSPPPELEYWAVPLLAVLAQCVGDLLSVTIREWLGRGIAPAAQVRVILSVYAIDACLTPIGFVVAMAAGADQFVFLAILPLLALLAALARDRGARIREAVDRLDQLTEEHARLDRAIHRIGEAFGSQLDRAALIDIGVRTAAEALGAEAGRAVVEGAEVDDAAMAAAEREARRTGALRVARHGDRVAIAQPLADEVLVVVRRGREFTHEEQALFGYLAHQTALAIENVALHDQLRREATVDELTGLANHRRFHEAIRQEATRTDRSGRPTGLALVDIDDFKRINDGYGHQLGDVVLKAVAGVVGGRCRATDLAARYGGDALAVILSETDLEGAWTIGESVRRDVAELALSLPDGTPLHVTVSVGVSALEPGMGDAVTTLIEAADIALSHAKRAGKNRTRSTGWAAAAGVETDRPGNRFSRAASPRPLP